MLGDTRTCGRDLRAVSLAAYILLGALLRLIFGSPHLSLEQYHKYPPFNPIEETNATMRAQ